MTIWAKILALSQEGVKYFLKIIIPLKNHKGYCILSELSMYLCVCVCVYTLSNYGNEQNRS